MRSHGANAAEFLTPALSTLAAPVSQKSQRRREISVAAGADLRRAGDRPDRPPEPGMEHATGSTAATAAGGPPERAGGDGTSGSRGPWFAGGQS